MIEYVDVHKAFDVPVLSGVNLTVETGETLSIVGPSGTGKSVLLKTTLALIVPDRGDVRVDGRSVYQSGPATLHEIRREVGYVFQYAALFDRSTGRREVLRRVCASLEAVNLEPGQILAKLPAELSGGMRKRVGLARAIVGEPRILLYDEPVTGLDPVNTAAVEHLITAISERMGVTSIVVTHDIEGALAISDRIALLDHGKLRFVGEPVAFRESAEPLVRAFGNRDAAQEAALKIMEEP
jgi:phospholipid/cholesterol/gamma-HCH transport system ATP-binding protein